MFDETISSCGVVAFKLALTVNNKMKHGNVEKATAPSSDRSQFIWHGRNSSTAHDNAVVLSCHFLQNRLGHFRTPLHNLPGAHGQCDLSLAIVLFKRFLDRGPNHSVCIASE
jgi:hypothetical protein